ncbi:zinc finger MYM-type protein 1-like isoform X2 [Aphis gossypii]|uniref:zinc finger MYM-type protein 1-like isoform X2 n=1 Tax=Aphis gossypii TaxID=80765 RepID=UPI0021594555|nr:zinc finger MYM-type protein 1-like isoform X2 [Aphis gossypii]
MSTLNKEECICGKKKLMLNDTNWKRHTTSCKMRKSKNNNSDISSFFKRRSVNIIETSSQRKKQRPDIGENAIAVKQFQISSSCDKIQEEIVVNPFKDLEIDGDPAIFTKIEKFTPDLIEFFFKKGPSQPLPNDLPDKHFPKDKIGRSFHESWYWKGNGSVTKRKWLSYSIKIDKVFCHYCVLFKTKQSNCHWTKYGFNLWKNGPAKIIMHETSEDHIMSSIKHSYKEASFPLIPSITEKLNADKCLNKKIISHLIDLTLFLGRHSLSFRGHREGWDEEIRGNFKDLVVLLAKYSPELASYITEIQIKGRKANNFLSWQRQNQLIKAISKNILNVIKKELVDAKFFSISLDTTFDVSRKEQVSLIFRYINKNTYTVHERLVAVKETTCTTGLHLFGMFETICQEMSINWKELLIGQSFDGAASMRGEYKGLQSYIKEQNPCATYIWCCAHRLSLVIVDAVSNCTEARDLFGNMETLYEFISCSKKRIGLYSDYQKKYYPKKQLRRLKRVETTRWSSHASALQTVFETFDALIDTLFDLKDDKFTDRVCSVKADSLMNYMLTERFILTSLVFLKIFDITNPLNKFLQGKNIDLLGAVNYIENVSFNIKELRNDNKFELIVLEKDKFIESKKDNLLFTPLVHSRVRRIKKMPGEVASDVEFADPVQNFKIKSYYAILDIVSTQIQERFNENSTPLLKDISLFQRKRLKDVSNNVSSLPVDAFQGFESIYEKFVSAIDLRREYVQFANAYFSFEKFVTLPKKIHNVSDHIFHDPDDEQDFEESGFGPTEQYKDLTPIQTIYNVCHMTGLKDVFPAISTALAISLTLPVSSASPERAFSKLKLIKTRLRSTMIEDRLEALMIISCEKDIPVDNTEVINIFSSYSSVLRKLLY